MKTSLIFTTYNEEDFIAELMESIKKQTELPDEIVVVDSFSKDNTVDIIKSFHLRNLKILRKECNISGGRNEAIKNTANGYILLTDAGCVLDKDWVKEMKQAFRGGGVDYVMGNFKPLKSKSFIGRGISAVSIQSAQRLSRDPYFASARSMAFKKNVWKEVGGFPEGVYTGEDTKFNIAVKNKRFKSVFAEKAVLYWHPRESLKKFLKQFRLYGKGDRNAKNLLQVPDRLLIVIVYSLFHLLLIGGIFYRIILRWDLIIFGIFLLVDTLRYSRTNPLKLVLLWPFVYLKRLSYTVGVLF